MWRLAQRGAVCVADDKGERPLDRGKAPSTDDESGEKDGKSPLRSARSSTVAPTRMARR